MIGWLKNVKLKKENLRKTSLLNGGIILEFAEGK